MIEPVELSGTVEFVEAHKAWGKSAVSVSFCRLRQSGLSQRDSNFPRGFISGDIEALENNLEGGILFDF